MNCDSCETCGIGCCPGKRLDKQGWCPNWRSPAEVQKDARRMEAERWKN